MIDFEGTPPIMIIALCVAIETSKNTISTWIFFEDIFSMKHDTFLILKLLIKFLKELVVGQGLFSAKSPCLTSQTNAAIVKLCLSLLAHLSRRLIGELIVYTGIRRPSSIRPSSVLRPSVNIFKQHLN